MHPDQPDTADPQSVADGQPAADRQPAADGQPAIPPTAPSQTLAVVSLVTGIVGIVLSFVAGLGILPAIAGVVTGHMALKREPHARGLAIAGLSTGYVGLALSIVFAVVIVAPLILAWLFIASYGSMSAGL
ncbi:MAG TPA: DUF4190 domain-containing protein [Microcella sp.]|nr:DUF4190 domain-containing protein [Microcella sp.]